MLSVCTLCMYIFFQRGLCFLPCFCFLFFLLKNKNGAVIDADFLSHYFTCCWPGQAEGGLNDGWLYALLPHQADENEFSSKTSKYLTLLFFHFQFFMCFSFQVLFILFFFFEKKRTWRRHFPNVVRCKSHLPLRCLDLSLLTAPQA